jgi:hypothetical protein
MLTPSLRRCHRPDVQIGHVTNGPQNAKRAFAGRDDQLVRIVWRDHWDRVRRRDGPPHNPPLRQSSRHQLSTRRRRLREPCHLRHRDGPLPAAAPLDRARAVARTGFPSLNRTATSCVPTYPDPPVTRTGLIAAPRAGEESSDGPADPPQLLQRSRSRASHRFAFSRRYSR